MGTVPRTAWETELGRPLFNRGAHSLELTAAGVKFLEACVSIAETYDSAVAAIRRLRSRPAYALTLIGPLYIREIAELVSSCAAAVRHDHEFKTQLIAESSAPYLDVLRSGKADIAIASFPDEKEMREIESLGLYRWRLCIAVRQHHRLARLPGDVPFSELDGETVRLEKGVTLSGLKQRFLDLSEAPGIRFKVRARQCSIYDLHLEEVTDEVLFTSEEIMQRFSYPGFIIKRIADDDCFFDMRACWSTQSGNPAVPLFIEELRRLLGEGRSEGAASDRVASEER